MKGGDGGFGNVLLEGVFVVYPSRDNKYLREESVLYCPESIVGKLRATSVPFSLFIHLTVVSRMCVNVLQPCLV